MKHRKYFLNFAKEEAWLNEMARDGHLLSHKSGTVYTFTRAQAAESRVHIDYQPTMGRCDYTNYLAAYYEAGWQIVHGSHSAGAKYFITNSAQPGHNAATDSPSTAPRYARSITVQTALLIPLLVVCCILWAQGALWPSTDQWYMTPGLWDKQGAELFTAITFETLFVTLRMGIPILLIGGCLWTVAAIAYQSLLYRKATPPRPIRHAPKV